MFYTYLWLREDGTPYYVGKGTKNRAYISFGHIVHKPVSKFRVFVQYWGSEEEALEIEKWYIVLFGRKDIGTGCLRNLTDGGENPPSWSGKKHSAITKEKMRKSRIGHAVSEEVKERMRDILMRVRPWRHGTQQGRWKHRCGCSLCVQWGKDYQQKRKLRGK